MADSDINRSVCDLTLIMRTRLFCGLYNRYTVPPRWQWLARAYCLFLHLILLTFTSIYVMHYYSDPLCWLFHIPAFCQYSLAHFISFWTEDRYIYTFYSQNRITDVTLDSSMVFNSLKKQMKRIWITTIVIFIAHYTLGVAICYQLSFVGLIGVVHVVLSFFLEQLYTCSGTNKMLIMGLYNSRIVILRRRLERYGFRTIGRAPPQPYCQIYDEILKNLNATDNPLKILIFFDIISYSLMAIGDIYYIIQVFQWQALPETKSILILLLVVGSVLIRSLISLGHVSLLESAAAHCEAMKTYIVVQLIKTPTEEERQRMYQFLNTLEQEGARYRVLRALPLDARFVLGMLGFCSGQAIVLTSMLSEKSH